MTKIMKTLFPIFTVYIFSYSLIAQVSSPDFKSQFSHKFCLGEGLYLYLKVSPLDFTRDNILIEKEAQENDTIITVLAIDNHLTAGGYPINKKYLDRDPFNILDEAIFEYDNKLVRLETKGLLNVLWIYRLAKEINEKEVLNSEIVKVKKINNNCDDCFYIMMVFGTDGEQINVIWKVIGNYSSKELIMSSMDYDYYKLEENYFK